MSVTDSNAAAMTDAWLDGGEPAVIDLVADWAADAATAARPDDWHHVTTGLTALAVVMSGGDTAAVTDALAEINHPGEPGYDAADAVIDRCTAWMIDHLPPEPAS